MDSAASAPCASAARAPADGADDLADEVARVTAADGWEAGCAVVEQHWDRFALTRPDVLLGALAALPGTAFVERPSLLSAIEYLRRVATDADPGRFRVRRGGASTGASGDLTDRLISLTSRAAEQRTHGQLDAACRTAAEARRIADEADDEMPAGVAPSLPNLRLQWARCLEAAGSDRAAIEYERVYEDARLTHQPALARRAAASLAWARADEGRMRLAAEWADRARAVALPSERYDAPLHLADALIAVDRLDDDAAAATLQRLDGVRHGEYALAALYVRAAAASVLQEIVILEDDLDAELTRHRDLVAEPGANRRYVAVARAFIALAQGRPLLRPTPDEPTPEDEVLLAAAEYRAGRTRQLARGIRIATGPDATPRIRAHALLLCGVSHLDAGHDGAAADALRRAHALIAHESLFHTYRVLTAAHLRASFAHVGRAMPDRVRERFASDERPSPAELVARLTGREREMLGGLTDGSTVAQLAAGLHVSVNTVKTTLRNAYAKLEVRSRAEAVDIAFLAGLGE